MSEIFKNIDKWLSGLPEKPSPQDLIPEVNIWTEYPNKVVISLANIKIPFTRPPKVWIPDTPDTNSMDGVFDIGNNNILIAGADDENQRIMVNAIAVGDIAVYQTPTFYAIHRVVEIGKDSQGRYFRFKGDNCFLRDSAKVRDSQIQWLSIGVIY